MRKTTCKEQQPIESAASKDNIAMMMIDPLVNTPVDIGAILVDTDDLMRVLRMGRVATLELSRQAGATIRIGRLVRHNVGKIKAYIDAQSGNE